VAGTKRQAGQGRQGRAGRAGQAGQGRQGRAGRLAESICVPALTANIFVGPLAELTITTRYFSQYS
jgi:hypothetical protein